MAAKVRTIYRVVEDLGSGDYRLYDVGMDSDGDVFIANHSTDNTLYLARDVAEEIGSALTKVIREFEGQEKSGS